MHILTHFDHNHNIQPLFNEHWIQAAGALGGLRTIPPLAIEESLDSDRGDIKALPYHREQFGQWGVENYQL